MARDKIVAARPMRLQNLGRDKHLAARGMPRQCPEQPGDPIGNPRMEGGVATRGRFLPVENQHGEAEKISSMSPLYRLRALRPIASDLHKGRAPRAEINSRSGAFGRSKRAIVSRRAAATGLALASPAPFERVPPPLQPDFAKQGLGDDFVHAGDFKTERIEGVDVPPQARAGQKGSRASGLYPRRGAVPRNRRNPYQLAARARWRLPPAFTPASSRGWRPAPDPPVSPRRPR